MDDEKGDGENKDGGHHERRMRVRSKRTESSIDKDGRKAYCCKDYVRQEQHNPSSCRQNLHHLTPLTYDYTANPCRFIHGHSRIIPTDLPVIHGYSLQKPTGNFITV
jgi:hypothetical protein